MNEFDFLVCQLEIGCESKPHTNSQDIACQIVEQYFLPGQQVVGSSVHYARTELNEVEAEEELEV